MDDRFLKRLMATMKCGICGQRYEAAHINVLGHQDDLWFLSVFCPACHSQGLVAAVIKEGRPPEIITDLTEAERSRFHQIGPITADDLLDMHNFLKDFEGDFSSLFSKE